ncbi:MAG TPA: hypothetical protein VFT74_09975, partial [Isosphaeraceae bacterium]|nr:hypothetical protein [Isosphaeraceae bacterium]
REQGERAVSAFVAEYEREACCARWCWMLGELIGAPVEVAIEPNPPRPSATEAPGTLRTPGETAVNRAG